MQEQLLIIYHLSQILLLLVKLLNLKLLLETSRTMTQEFLSVLMVLIQLYFLKRLLAKIQEQKNLILIQLIQQNLLKKY
jgi:hypothetical protein